MRPPQTPYTADLGDRDPIAAMRASVDRVLALTAEWTTLQFEWTYAPGKWSARQILTHLAQTEIGLGHRARMAVSTPNYVAQPFDQDRWIGLDAAASGRQALEAFVAIAVLNAAAFEAWPPAARAIEFSHPEYGLLTVDWVIHQIAGHEIHHLKQLEVIAAS